MTDIMPPPGLALPQPTKVADKATDLHSKAGSVVGKKGKAYTETTASDLGEDSLTSLSGAESVASLSDFDSSESEKVEPAPLPRRTVGTLPPSSRDWSSHIASMNALDLTCAGGKPLIGMRKKAAAIPRAPLRPLPPAKKVPRSRRGPPPGFEGLPKSTKKDADLEEPMRVPISAPLKLDLLVKSGPGAEASFPMSTPQELAEWGRAAYPVDLADQAWGIGAQCAWEAMMGWQAQDPSSSEWGMMDMTKELANEMATNVVEEEEARLKLNPKARLFTPGS